MIAHDPVRLTALGCFTLALIALAASPVISWPLAGGIAAGLVAGSLNPLLARRAINSALPFQATSLMRLALLSALAIGVGFLIGVPYAPIFGVAGAQFVLVLASTWAVLAS